MNIDSVIIIGAGRFATQVVEAFESSNIHILGFIDDISTSTFMGYDILDMICPNVSLFCAIGDVKTRKDIYSKYPNKFINCIHPKAHIGSHTTIGDGNYIGPNATIMPYSTIGSNNIIDPLVVISHDNIIGDHNHMAAHSCSLGSVTIGNCNLIGANRTILPNIKINNNNILGAGAVCTKNISNNNILKGIPAK